MSLASFLTFYHLAGSLVLIAALLMIVRFSLKRAQWSAGARRIALLWSALVLIGWFAAAFALAWSGAFTGPRDQLPTIQYGVLAPILVGLLAAAVIAPLRRLLASIPISALIAVQFYRSLGVVFLILLALHRLPALFALPAGIGDVAVGLSAPFVALAYARNPERSAALARRWNFFGLLDLAVALGTGVMTSPSPLQLFAFDAPNTLIGAFPLVLIPVFLVPLSILIHFTALAKLRRAADPATCAPHAA
ncbi:MAG: hypothetical protein JSR45_00410 [Proteobacteria bacterium]|nr:hypothetical protein [Pseudomonadota bacterium]